VTEAGQRRQGAVRRWMSWRMLWLGIVWPLGLNAQSAIAPDWTVVGGAGFVFRQVQSGSFGLNARISRVVLRAGGASVAVGAAWQGYLSSDAWGPGEDVAPCPPEGCGEPLRDEISVLGLEVTTGYIKSTSANPIHPSIGAGLYRISTDDSTGAHVGINAGLVIPFQKSVAGPGLEIRYFRVFGHSRFKSLLLFPLRWSF
jgi:hypothetical protein